MQTNTATDQDLTEAPILPHFPQELASRRLTCCGSDEIVSREEPHITVRQQRDEGQQELF
jgi:hypothetical protein